MVRDGSEVVGKHVIVGDGPVQARPWVLCNRTFEGDQLVRRQSGVYGLERREGPTDPRGTIAQVPVEIKHSLIWSRVPVFHPALIPSASKMVSARTYAPRRVRAMC